jgi:hypothetical protein
MITAYKIIVGILQGREPLWRAESRWGRILKQGLEEGECEGVGWFHLA